MPMLRGGRRKRRTPAADGGAASQAGVAGEQGGGRLRVGARRQTPGNACGRGISGVAVGRRVFIGLQEIGELVTESYRMLAPEKPSALLG